MAYLRWNDYEAWSKCPGRPALEESEGGVPDEVPRLTQSQRSELDGRKAALDGATAVEILPLQSLDVGAITGERGALAWGSVVLAEYKDHSALEVYPADKILGLAALIKYSIIHQFTNTNVGTPAELYEFGAAVTEAAHLSLNLRAAVTALEHLTPGPYCKTCKAAYRCPALTKTVHTEVFGPNEAPADPEAKPVTVPVDAELAAVQAKIPLIKAWIAAVEAAAGIRGSKEPVKRPRRRKSRKGKRPKKPHDDPGDRQ